MMAEEKQKVEKEIVAKAEEKPKARYKYEGVKPKDEKIFNLYGTHGAANIKLRPWAMTDEEIDAVIARYPHLARLWKKL